MKNAICSILYLILIIVVPGIFSINGFGIDTWQWWTVSVSIFMAYLIGAIGTPD